MDVIFPIEDPDILLTQVPNLTLGHLLQRAELLLYKEVRRVQTLSQLFRVE